MRYIVPLLFLVIAIAGCDPVKDLDWDRTAKDQHLRIGNRVRVESVTYGLPIYELKKTDNFKSISVKKTWGTTLDLWTYNPNIPENDRNPNAPIGTVIGTIYNPMHNETLMKLRDLHPDTAKLGESPLKKHRFEVIGRIHSFKRAVKPDADDTKPDISLSAVRIHVESITLKKE